MNFLPGFLNMLTLLLSLTFKSQITIQHNPNMLSFAIVLTLTFGDLNGRSIFY
jgi:hypothetical protein